MIRGAVAATPQGICMNIKVAVLLGAVLATPVVAAGEILEQVVVKVNAIKACLAGQRLIEIGEVIVDKMGERLRWVHA